MAAGNSLTCGLLFNCSLIQLSAGFRPQSKPKTGAATFSRRCPRHSAALLELYKAEFSQLFEEADNAFRRTGHFDGGEAGDF